MLVAAKLPRDSVQASEHRAAGEKAIWWRTVLAEQHSALLRKYIYIYDSYIDIDRYRYIYIYSKFYWLLTECRSPDKPIILSAKLAGIFYFAQ